MMMGSVYSHDKRQHLSPESFRYWAEKTDGYTITPDWSSRISCCWFVISSSTVFWGRGGGGFFTSYGFSLVEIFITDNSWWFLLCCASLASLLITRSEADLFKDYKTGRAGAASSAGGLINAGAEKKPGLEEEKLPGGENGRSGSD